MSKQALPKGLQICKGGTRNKLKDVRNAVQHQEKHLFEGKISQPHLFLPLGAGDEAQVDDKTVLTINRIEFRPGLHRVTFTVDVDNHVQESREFNNSTTITVRAVRRPSRIG